MLDRLLVLLKKLALKVSSLTRLERRGWIEVLQSEDRRRPYCITGAGEVALREQVKTLHQVVSISQQRLAPG